MGYQTFNNESEDDVIDSSNDENYDSEADSLSEDGETNNSEADVISKLKEITGREFKDEEDFKKHYKNLSSFVGKKIEAKPKSNTNKDEIISDLSFKVDHPELKDHFDIIKMVSKYKGISYDEAISDNMFKEIVEVRQSKKGESIIHSNNKISPANSSINKLKSNVHTEDGLVAFLKETLDQE